MKPGFYLVTPDDARYFISATVNPAALDRACDRHLSADTGWRYWVDRYHGLDIQDRPHWANWNHEDLFHDAASRACGEID